jgi:hypothetical protein
MPSTRASRRCELGAAAQPPVKKSAPEARRFQSFLRGPFVLGQATAGSIARGQEDPPTTNGGAEGGCWHRHAPAKFPIRVLLRRPPSLPVPLRNFPVASRARTPGTSAFSRRGAVGARAASQPRSDQLPKGEPITLARQVGRFGDLSARRADHAHNNLGQARQLAHPERTGVCYQPHPRLSNSPNWPVNR